MSTNVLNIPTGSVPGFSPDTRLLEFKRRSPQVLGTVQIMVGLMLLLFGVVSCVFLDAVSTVHSVFVLTVYSGVFVWAPLYYIIAGSLTVAADRSMSRCMIKGSMGMNIVAAMISCTATILYSLDAAGVFTYWDDPFIYSSLSMGVSGVQCVFNLLVFIISICVSVFGCKANCCSCCQQTPILQAVVMGNHLPEGSTVMSRATPSAYAPPSYTEASPYQKVVHPKAVGSRGDAPPPGGWYNMHARQQFN